MSPLRILLRLGWAALSMPAMSAPMRQSAAVSRPQDPKIVGAMKDVMWNGRISGKIDLDAIPDKDHLYGLGPVEYLKGEILVLDGIGYVSEVVSDSTMRITETLKSKAPFFSYANIEKWKKLSVPDSLTNLVQLETYLNRITLKRARPFLFKLNAILDTATIHVVNLPHGAKVASPEDAHMGQRRFGIRNQAVTLIGFFSTEHQAIFTHHDTFLHIHLITDDRKKMGHLEDMAIRAGSAELFLPE